MSEQRTLSPSKDQKTGLNKQPVPWNPYQIFGFVFFATTIVVGILLGINWKRLGKPEWQVKTILLSLLVPALMIPVAIGWITIFAADRNWPIQFAMSVPMLAFGANFGYIWALARLQNGAYKVYEAQGPEALARYKYDLIGAVLFGINVVFIVGIVGTFILPLLGGR